MNTEELIKTVGMKYSKLDSTGNALGCMAPIYMAYPEEKGNLRFEWIPEGISMRDYMLSLFDKYCVRVEISKLQPGDFITLNMPLENYHVALYLGKGKLLHCSQSHGMEIVSYKLYSRRVERGYRFNGSSNSGLTS